MGISSAAANSAPGVSAQVKPATCSGPNGSIIASASGGVTPYTYSIDGINFQSGNIFNSLAAGSYILQLKDANGALASTAVIVTNEPGPQLSLTVKPASCDNTGGSIIAGTTSGKLPIEFSRNGIDFNSSPVFADLASSNYRIQARDANGCIISAIVKVPLQNDLVIDLGGDRNICEGDSILLKATFNGTANGGQFIWGTSDQQMVTPLPELLVKPLVTTRYVFSMAWGACYNSEEMMVYVRPAPIANAGKDQVICFGESAVVFAGHDTSIAIHQPIQLSASDVNNSGFTKYFWTPSEGLTNPFIRDPVLAISNSKKLTVRATTPAGCESSDEIFVSVYKGPDIYVPNSFTPNGDGINDRLTPIPIGIKAMTRFTVYDRWGNKIFQSFEANRGWDGRFNGHPIGTNTFTWIAEGIGYNDIKIIRKGIVLLIPM